jgi:hypothetical protein
VSRWSSRGSTMMLLLKTSAGSAEDFDAVQLVAMMTEECHSGKPANEN